ncbi:ring-cleaving dioxygenase [Alkalibacterium sp. 20]|uniref:ring-cleaving dioxygenase n=1 Tax=Alkalibacterium sp. 20 TaxID=1798803 RepID=UPI0009000424|nr:ring-cleaving dioxygenase [Alkalibacterium sp. 20]OJF94623.1 glyoxalase [Alkalibacterium sp. 20]
MSTILGHHHISMLVKNAKGTNRFYKDVLGLRRVKVTVNQDDPSMYHLFYGDKTGSPGTGLTFFEMPSIGRTHRGTNAITRIGLMVPSDESLNYWKVRFEQLDVYHGSITTYAKRKALNFEDPDGLQLVLLVADGEEMDTWESYEQSEVPVEHQIRGMGTIEISVRDSDRFTKTLTDVLKYKEVYRDTTEVLFQTAKEDSYGEILVKHLDGPDEKPGRGSIHHLAIRVSEESELAHWDETARQNRFSSSVLVDRYYFKSLYFREPSGILFEVATDGPGFTVDQTSDHLGEKLVLPTFLEDRREEIESRLEPID